MRSSSSQQVQTSGTRKTTKQIPWDLKPLGAVPASTATSQGTLTLPAEVEDSHDSPWMVSETIDVQYEETTTSMVGCWVLAGGDFVSTCSGPPSPSPQPAEVESKESEVAEDVAAVDTDGPPQLTGTNERTRNGYGRNARRSSGNLRRGHQTLNQWHSHDLSTPTDGRNVRAACGNRKP